MSYSVRHQIFVSSTFTDLVEERAEVIQAVWELDCIPTGMEAFVASNESQWDVIKRVIDESDYYVLIVGGRYGSVTDEGVSYTEKEYKYAKKLGVPVLAFVHSDPSKIALGKSETAPGAREKLEAFREQVMADHPIRRWSTPTELGSIVSRSLSREIKINPRPGWIRNDGSSPIALLEQINKLSNENSELRDKLTVVSATTADDTLESGEDSVEIYGYRTIFGNGIVPQSSQWRTSVSWNELFKDIGPALINEATENDIKSTISRFHGWDEIAKGRQARAVSLALESWNEVLIQFRALGYIVPGTKKRGVNDRNSYWMITLRGDKHLLSLLARRK